MDERRIKEMQTQLGEKLFEHLQEHPAERKGNRLNQQFGEDIDHILSKDIVKYGVQQEIVKTENGMDYGDKQIFTIVVKDKEG